MGIMPLNIRKWDCPNCDVKSIDSDIIISINILKQRLKELNIQTVESTATEINNGYLFLTK